MRGTLCWLLTPYYVKNNAIVIVRLSVALYHNKKPEPEPKQCRDTAPAQESLRCCTPATRVHRGRETGGRGVVVDACALE